MRGLDNDPKASRVAGGGLWSIQYLRGVAALSLVAFHTFVVGPRPITSVPYDVFRIGTDIFFVTSGFLAWSVTAGRDVNPFEFLVRRLARIAPLYWVLTLVPLPAALLRPRLYWMIDTDLDHLIKSLLFVPDFDNTGRLYPVILQAWMLNSLVFLYILFGMLLFLPRRMWLWSFTAL